MMNKISKWGRQVPGWVIIVVIFGGLYLTGWHTEVIGQGQRLLLATGLMKPRVPAPAALEAGKPPGTAQSSGVPEPAFPPADYNFELQNLRGEPVSLQSLKGKVVFMNFWATWCPPCVAEMPNIQSLYGKMPADQVAFVMVSLDDNPAKARKYIDRKGFTFPVYTPNGPMPPAYASQVIPTTFVLSPEGKVAARYDGMADYDNARFRDFLLTLAQKATNKAAAGAAGASSQDRPAAAARAVNSQEAKALLARQPATTILDVRTGQEFAGGHLGKALNLDYNAPDFQTQLLGLDKTRPYLVYCAVGGRSGKAARLMQEMGFREVYNVTEGFVELKNAGIPVAE
jgi:rhodanese-related sulfurtransferase/thiol-disulfide isomerase/thioredoxin